MSELSTFLRRCREQAGHASAREFYKASGGRPGVGCTYNQYLNIETGRSTPKAGVFNAIVVHLRIWREPEKARQVCRAYLASLLGAGEPLEFILRSLGPAPPTPGSPRSPLRKALTQAREARLKPLTAEQSRLIRSGPVTYWVFRVLSSDSGSWRAERLAAVLGMPAKGVRRALADLASLGLVVREEDGSYWSPSRERHVSHEHPPARKDYAVAPFMAEFRRAWAPMLRRHGREIFQQYLVLRASETDVQGYFPYLAQAVGGLGVYDTIDKGPDTAILLVEASVRRLLPF